MTSNYKFIFILIISNFILFYSRQYHRFMFTSVTVMLLLVVLTTITLLFV